MNQNVETSTKQALFDFAVTKRVPNPIAVTFTLKQACSIPTDRGFFIFKPDRIDYQTNTRFFLNRMNQSVYGRRFTKYKKRLLVLPVFEGTRSIRTHLHLAIERPNEMQYSEFFDLIKHCWKKTPLGYHNIDIQEVNNYEGWINYMLKSTTKNVDLLSSIDVGNLHLN